MKNFLFLALRSFPFIILGFSVTFLDAQNWQQNNALYNTSGVPSLTFSAPRFGDLDADGDMDMILGSSDSPPVFLENVGTSTNPSFSETGFIEHDITSLEAEICEPVDLDNDGDLDLVAGGFSGLTFFQNTGDSTAPIFSRDTSLFSGLTTGLDPIPTVADINGDGAKDVLIGLSEDGSVKCYFNTGTGDAPAFAESSSFYPGIDVGLYAYPKFVDPDSDGDWDLIIGRDNLNLAYYQNTGTSQTPSWTSQDSYCSGLAGQEYFATPTMVDLNGNGILDIIYGHYAGPLKYYRNTGTATSPTWTENTSLFGGILDVGGASNPCLIDWDGDGDLDLISGFNMGDLKYYRNIGNSSGPAWQAANGVFNSIDGETIYSSVTAGDIDNNGHLDLIMGFVNADLVVYENNGSHFNLNTSYFSGISIGYWLIPRLIDMDYDGDLDLVVGSDDGNLHYFENQGTPESADFVLNDSYFSGIDGPGNCAPAPVDFDHNGTIDILMGGISGNLTYYTNLGTPTDPSWVEDDSTFAGLEVSQNATPAFGDLDGDGDPDLTIGSYDGTFSYFENQNPIVAVDENSVQVPDQFEITSVFPNPFNPTVRIQYQLPEKSNIRIDIYNLMGQEITTLVNGYQDAGIKSIQWDASVFPSGMYFVQIKSARFIETRKMLLLK